MMGCGIIPARAGFTGSTCRSAVSWRDHPRSRGVYRGRFCEDGHGGGSSPLARGLPQSPRPGRVRRWIIPARAGFTAASSPSRRADGIIPARAGFTGTNFIGDKAIGDHPRSRGVYAVFRVQQQRPAGSSPLARGLPHPPRRQGRVSRIIPARAGFTAPTPQAGSGQSDHPRSRGVYYTEDRSVIDAFGSSPLARGLR